FLECALLIPACIGVAVWLGMAGTARTAEGEVWTLFLLSLSRLVTVGPLLMFGMGAKRLRLSTMGVLQYIAPTILFFEAVIWFGEPLNPWQLVAFVMIWAALVIYTVDGVARSRATA